jgi:hypothetical protein
MKEIVSCWIKWDFYIVTIIIIQDLASQVITLKSILKFYLKQNHVHINSKEYLQYYKL